VRSGHLGFASPDVENCGGIDRIPLVRAAAHAISAWQITMETRQPARGVHGVKGLNSLPVIASTAGSALVVVARLR